jgi:putative heme transporter
MSPKFKRWLLIGFGAVVLLLLYFVREVLLPFVLSGVFVYLLAPAVDYLSSKSIGKFKLSRGLSVVLVFMGFVTGLGLLILLVLPPVYQEVLKIANETPAQIEHFRLVTLPNWTQRLEALSLRYNLDINVEAFIEHTLENLYQSARLQVDALPENMRKIVEVLFSTLSSFLVIFIVTIFVLIDLPRIKSTLLQMVPVYYRDSVTSLMKSIDRDLSGTIRGQLLICVINGTLTTLGLLMLNVKFAITIGFIAGVFSLIPVFGAVISTIPAVLIALTQSIWTALAVVGVIIIIHLIEANMLNPKILGHTVELHPAVIIFAIIVGEHFFGAMGLLFGVPVAAIVRSVLRFIYLEYFLEAPDLPLLQEDTSEEVHP